MAKFTTEHQEILELHKGHFISLRDAGFMRNIDTSVFNQLLGIYHQAIAVDFFNSWCQACVADMVYRLYTSYNAWLLERTAPKKR